MKKKCQFKTKYFFFIFVNLQVREQDESILANLTQYDCADSYVDVLVSDFSNSIWQKNIQFDSIITDRKPKHTPESENNVYLFRTIFFFASLPMIQLLMVFGKGRKKLTPKPGVQLNKNGMKRHHIIHQSRNIVYQICMSICCDLRANI